MAENKKIITPTEYSDIADLPKDLKIMADSIEEVIDDKIKDIDLSNYYNKQEIDSKIGTIETALDSIIGKGY